MTILSDAVRERHISTEKEIYADPYNIDLWKVYCDWLVGKGDPQGEILGTLIAGVVPENIWWVDEYIKLTGKWRIIADPSRALVQVQYRNAFIFTKWIWMGRLTIKPRPVVFKKGTRI